MKKILTTLFVVLACSLCVNAKSIQPIIFDDPSFDIHSSLLSPEQCSFFDQYVRAMERMEAGEQSEKLFFVERAKTNDGVVVAPLLDKINFNQSYPYNKLCPVVNGGRAVTGCVATAMAQVMRYYQFPAKGTGTFTYSGGSQGAQQFKLDDHPFDWAHMLPTYDGVSYTETQADAVANLMLACGASLNMNYSKDGSSAHTENIPGLLKNNFYYNKEIQYIDVSNSSNPEEDIELWGEDVVRPDLEKGRPLIFAGYPAVGQTGHCFVIDGYMIEDNMYYYHVNWGWGGVGNCWCLLTRLEEPGGDDYSGHNLSMVYWIHPNYPQAIEQTEAEKIVRTSKELRNGQVVIVRNNCVYTVQGQRIQ